MTDAAKSFDLTLGGILRRPSPGPRVHAVAVDIISALRLSITADVLAAASKASKVTRPGDYDPEQELLRLIGLADRFLELSYQAFGTEPRGAPHADEDLHEIRNAIAAAIHGAFEA